ncbi:MAG TPA: hypothetical protein VHE37_13310, partial [Nevskiaceae bacterium]|nr:hypothetical protein [Nevskiaceae bacterium]
MQKIFFAAALVLAALNAGAQSGPSNQGGMPSMQGQGSGPSMMGGEHHGPPPSVERAAIHKLLAQELSRASGRAPSEITQMLATSPPPEVARQLGLQPDAVKSAMQNAHAQLIQKALAAGLIDQADVPAIQQEDQRRMQQMPMMGEGTRSGMPPQPQGQNH